MGAHSISRKLRGIQVAPQVFNSSGALCIGDMDGNGPPLTVNDQSYTGQPLGDCAAVALAKYLSVFNRVEINARAIADWYLSQSPDDDGLNIDDAATALKTVPMLDIAGNPHTIGDHSGIDWTDQNAVMQALTQYLCIDTGVDSSCLENIVGDADGWILAGVPKLTNYDHSIDSFDYGPAGALAEFLKVNLNGKLGQDDFAVSPVTWGTRGIAEFESWCNMTGEAWVFEPTPSQAAARNLFLSRTAAPHKTYIFGD
jgi:hypothetical protein